MDDSRIEEKELLKDAGPPKSMKRALAVGAAWMTGLQLSSKVIEVGFAAVLARILLPADFGVIAGATIFIQFAALLAEIGIGATIIQLPDLTRNDIRTASTLVAINAVGYFVLIQLIAPFAGDFMGISGVTDVLRVLALVFLIQAIGVVPESILVRRLDVRRVMLAQLAVRIIGTGGVGMTLAWMGWGYWALVVAILAETGLKALWMTVLVRPPMRPLLTRSGIKRLLRRGAGFSVSRVINFVALRADNALVGRTMDAAALGYYSRAYNLMSVPSDLYSRIAERLIFPAMAQVQDDRPRLRLAFLRGLELTALIGLPISALLALLAPELVAFLLGPRWGAVIAPFSVLSAVTYLRLGAKVGGSLQRAKAATGSMIINQIIYASCVVGGCLIAYPHGLVAVATAVSIGVAVNYCIVNYSACRLAGLSFSGFLMAHAHAALLALACTIVALPVVLAMRSQGSPAIVVLTTTGAAVTLLGVMLVWFQPRWLLGDVVPDLLGDVRRNLSRRRLRSGDAS